MSKNKSFDKKLFLISERKKRPKKRRSAPLWVIMKSGKDFFSRWISHWKSTKVGKKYRKKKRWESV